MPTDVFMNLQFMRHLFAYTRSFIRINRVKNTERKGRPKNLLPTLGGITHLHGSILLFFNYRIYHVQICKINLSYPKSKSFIVFLAGISPPQILKIIQSNGKQDYIASMS